MSIKFAIHMIGLNRRELSEKCLASIARNSGEEKFHVILTNNGSDDGTRELFDKMKGDRVTVIHNETNEGFISPNNKAFEIAKKMGCQYCVAINNDVEVPEGWLEMLAAPLDADPLGALSGPSGTCRTLHPNMDGYPGERLDYIEGSCLCAKISIVSKQGPLFSDYLDLIYGDDSDLSLRMREAGYHIYQVPFEIKHVQCATTRDPAVKERCERAQKHNHEVGMKRWSFFLKCGHFNYPLVVKRKHAIGDVLLTTPVIAALKNAKPERPIWVQTDFPQVFQNNPDVEKAQVELTDMDDVFPVLDLNDAYEKRTEIGILDSYMLEMTARFPKTLGVVMDQPRLHPSGTDFEWADNLAREFNFGSKVCVMHADTTEWPGKQWPQQRFAEIATWLVLAGWHVVAVGTRPLPQNFDAVNLINGTNVLQLAALLSRASLFIGGDSFPFHAALAMRCPAVGIFGVTHSKFIVHGSGPKVCLDASNLFPSAGARHRATNVQHLDLGADAIESHSVEDVKAAVKRLGVL
jgi:GT2 family glycosyltransferase/ADP-heptose:LPS heptosyltransferase